MLLILIQHTNALIGALLIRAHETLKFTCIALIAVSTVSNQPSCIPRHQAHITPYVDGVLLIID